MAENKIIYYGKILIDLTGDTVTPETLTKGVTAHDASGSVIVGTNDGSDFVADVLNGTATEIINDKVEKIPQGFQENSQYLVKVSLPKLLIIAPNGFNACSKLAEANFPKVHTIQSAAFNSTALQKAYFPEVTTFNGWGYTFYGCRQLTKVYFPKLASNVQDADFNNCRALETLILGGDTFCALTASNVFNQTPMAGYNGKTGYIYVKKALIDNYKAATNWSVYASKFRAIEDYPEVLEGWT